MAGSLENTADTAPPALPSGFATVFYETFDTRGAVNPNDSWDTGANRGIWQTLYGGAGSNPMYNYAHSQVNVDVDDSNEIRITATHDNAPGTATYDSRFPSTADWTPDWLAGGISTAAPWNPSNPYAWENGRFEFRARVDGAEQIYNPSAGQYETVTAKGTGPAVLLWPADGSWPPEIDLLESPSPTRNGMYFSIHWKDATGQHQSVSYDFPGIDASQWHVYRLDWNGANMSFYVDGTKMRDDFGHDPHMKMSFGMQMFVASQYDSWYGGEPDGGSIKNGQNGGIGLEVDWVRVAQSNGTATPPLPATNTINGNNGSNTLNGTAGDDVINGLGGSDTINGKDGNDTIVGGAGKDYLTGGNGADTFKYAAVSDSGTGSGSRDVIRDFQPGADKIDLSAIDANGGLSGDQAFLFQTGSAFAGGGRGSIRIDQSNSTYTLIEIDTGNGGSAEMQIQLNKVASIAASDFIL
jgi:hypothetical protein